MKPNEFWWATVHGPHRPEVVEVTFEDGKPHRVYRAGTEIDIEPYELNACVRLIERVLPAGRAASAVEKLEDAWNDQDAPGTANIIAEAIELLQGGLTS